MANAVYPLYKQAILSAGTNIDLVQNTATDGPYVSLVDTGVYTYNTAHQFYSSVAGAGVIGDANGKQITTPTVSAAGTFDGVDVTFTAVSGATVEALVYHRHNSGANTTWKLFLYYDATGGGLPVTPNGGDITVTFNASGIFTI